MRRRLVVQPDREDDGRWIAEVADLPGVLAYGSTQVEAVARVRTLALRVIADLLEHGELPPFDSDRVRRRVSGWPSTKAKQVLEALLRIGWTVRRQRCSHPVLEGGHERYIFAFHDAEEIGPKMLAHHWQNSTRAGRTSDHTGASTARNLSQRPVAIQKREAVLASLTPRPKRPKAARACGPCSSYLE